MKKDRKVCIKVERVAERNHIARHALLRTAGRHQKPFKALRRLQKQCVVE